MNKQKQMELVRKRNSDLEKKINNLKFKLEYDEKLNREGFKRAKYLIAELEEIKLAKETELNELKKKQEEYQTLIDDLQKMRNEMISVGFGQPWYRRIFHKIKNT